MHLPTPLLQWAAGEACQTMAVSSVGAHTGNEIVLQGQRGRHPQGQQGGQAVGLEAGAAPHPPRSGRASLAEDWAAP